MSVMVSTTEGRIEKITPKLSLQWLHQDQLVLYQVQDTTLATVDALIESQIAVIRAWPQAKPFRMVQDLSAPAVVLSPYFRQRLDEVADAFRERNLSGYSAVILPDSVVYRVYTTFGRMVSRRAGPGMKQAYFMDKQEALAWIEQPL
jgi:hypothetical protein